VKWLQEMSYKLQDVKKDIYKDGHEHADVIEYRQNDFFPTLKALERRIVHMKLIQTNSGQELLIIFPENLLPIVLVVYDESTLNANDRRSKIWIKDDNILLKKKSCGKGIMVSDFLTLGGQLQVPEGTNLIQIPDYGIQAESPKRF